MKGVLSVCISLIFFQFSGYSSHIMGSDISWDCLGNDSFLITYRIYRDCNGVNLDNKGFSMETNCDTVTLTMTPISISDVTPLCKSACDACTASGSCSYTVGYGVQENVYQVVIGLKKERLNRCCKIKLNYTNCCRNTAITSGSSIEDYYTYAWFDICTYNCNNSPKFSNIPLIVAPAGRYCFYNEGISKVDKDSVGSNADSLVYSLEEPLQFANGTPATYNGSYSYKAPLRYLGFPKQHLKFPLGFTLDSLYGDISFLPQNSEVSIFTVGVTEYRNGRPISFIRREMEAIITLPSKNQPPYLKGVNCGLSNINNINACIGSTVSFKICGHDDNKSDTVKLELLSELPKGGSFTVIQDTGFKAKAEVSFKVDSSLIFKGPLVFFFRMTDNGCPYPLSAVRKVKIFINHNTKNHSNIEYGTVDSTCGHYYLKFRNPDSLDIQSKYWYVNDTLIKENVDSVVFTPSSTDSQFIKMIYKYEGCFYTLYDTLVPLPFNPIFIHNKLDTNLCKTEYYYDTIRISGGNGKIKSHWAYEDGIKDKIDTNRAIKIGISHRFKNLSIYAKDAKGCELKRFSKFTKLKTSRVILRNDTALCSNDTFTLNLPKEKTSIGSWYYNGTKIQSFHSGMFKPGTYELNYFNKLKDACTIDSSIITFGPIPSLKVDTFIETCQEHSNIELSSNYPHTVWSGIGIRNDSIFSKSSDSINHYYLLAKYTNKYGCSDSVNVTIAVTGDTSALWTKQLNWHFCKSTRDSLVVFNNLLSGSFSNNPDYLVPDGKNWWIKVNKLSLGNQTTVFSGYDSNYCSANFSFNFKLENDPAFSILNKEGGVCKDHDSMLLEASPPATKWEVDSLVSSGANYYMKIGDLKSGIYIIKAELNQNGCVVRDSIKMYVEDTVHMEYVVDTHICGQTIFNFKKLKLEGKWVDRSGTYKVGIKKRNLNTNNHDTGVYLFDYVLTSGLPICLVSKPATIRISKSTPIFIQDTFQVCANKSLDLSSKVSGIWFGEGVRHKAGNYYFEWDSLLAYQIADSVSITSKNGCVTTKGTQINVLKIPNVNTGKDFVECMDSQRIDFVLRGGSGTWSGYNVSPGKPLAHFVPSDPKGVYNYVLTNKGTNGCTNSDTLQVTLGAAVTVNISPVPSSGFAPLSVSFKSISSNAYYYYWDFGNGDKDSGLSMPTYLYTKAGTYYVKVLAYDSLGVCFKSGFTAKPVEVWDPNGIEETTPSGLVKIYPNPAKNEFVIEMAEPESEALVSIYNINGELLSANGYNNQPLVFGSDLISGLYMVVVSINGELIHKQIVSKL